MNNQELPVADFFDPAKVKDVWRVHYQERSQEAQQWAEQHHIHPALQDEYQIGLLLVDVQNTFCIPEFELYVGGESGTGAVDDNRRLCEFIYRNLKRITRICPTMDTHQTAQIFHSIFLVNESGRHPDPYTQISLKDIENGSWRMNPLLYGSHPFNDIQGGEYLRHYAKTLKASGKYELTIWPYHAILGGIGHALVSAVEEALFFHAIARQSQPDLQIKGDNPLTEHYSILRPEVLTSPDGRHIARKNKPFMQKLLNYDALVIAGQAKSHCVAWTVQDLLDEILSSNPKRVQNVYLLEDCTSPVVIPGGIDYTNQADDAFQRFADAGMHIVQSTDPVTTWPGFQA